MTKIATLTKPANCHLCFKLFLCREAVPGKMNTIFYEVKRPARKVAGFGWGLCLLCCDESHAKLANFWKFSVQKLVPGGSNFNWLSRDQIVFIKIFNAHLITYSYTPFTRKSLRYRCFWPFPKLLEPYVERLLRKPCTCWLGVAFPFLLFV